MNKEFKKHFFISLLPVLLVISNLIGMKYTNFLDITVGADFLTYPFTFLCTLLIINYGSVKEAYRSILSASLIQLLITISYKLVVSLETQSLMPDSAIYVNHLFEVNEIAILASILAFIISHWFLIYAYQSFKEYKKELYGLVISLLGASFINAIIFFGIKLENYEFIYIINMILSNVIIDILLTVIIVVLFYVLKSRDKINSEHVNEEVINDNHNFVIEKTNNGLLDVSQNKIIKKDKFTKKTNKGYKNQTRNSNNRYQKNQSHSQKIVKKENK